MGKANNNWYSLSDKAIIETIGSFIKETRLSQNKNQQQLADAAGINRSTLSQVENGKEGTIMTLIQILRALQQLQVLEHFQIETKISPIQLAKIQEKGRRERARNQGNSENKKPQTDW